MSLQAPTSTGNITKNFISLTNLLDDREIAPSILDLQNDGAWTTMLQQLGYTNYVESKEWFFDSFFNDPKLVVCTVAAISAGQGTAALTFTTSTVNYVKVGDTLLFPDGRSPLVTSVTPGATDTIICKVDSGVLNLAVGDNFIVNGNAMEEGSDASTPMRFGLSSIRNNIQILDEVWKITDVQLGAKRTVEFNGSYYVTSQAAIDSLQRLQAKMAMTWWSSEVSQTYFNDTVTASTLTGPAGRPVQRTRGINQYITSYGITPQVSMPGTVATPDLQDVCDRLTGVKAPSDYFMFGGNSPKTVMDIWAKNLNSSGANSVRLQGDNPNMSFKAEEFSFGGFNFKLMALPILSNPQTFNYKASGSTIGTIGRSLFLFPSGNAPVYGGSPRKYFSMRFAKIDPSIVKEGLKLANDNYISEFSTGAFAGVGLDANFTSRYYTMMGVDANLPQLFGRWIVK